jgi:hypothetical protein
MDADEVTEWAAYAQLDPFGGVRADYHAALISTMVINSQAGKEVVKVKDLIPTFGPPRLTPRMSGREIRARLETMFPRQGGQRNV